MTEAFQSLVAQETEFERIVAQFGVPIVPSRPQGFETLVLLILEQQVSVDSAKATYFKLRSQVSKMCPEYLADLSTFEYRQVGVSRQKASYIIGLSQAILNKELELESFSQQSDSEVREQLIKIKGIGHWTIDVYLMFSLQSPDILPLGDVAVVHAFKDLFGIHQKEEMQLYAERWRPFRSFATYLMWHHYLNKRNRTITYNYE